MKKNFEYKNCGQGVHDHGVLVDLVHISEGGKMQISPKLEVCGEKEVDIRNQRPRLRMNSLFLGRKEGGGAFVKECQLFLPKQILDSYTVNSYLKYVEKY